MADVVDWCIVEEHQVLGRRAAAHLETARRIALGLDARQQLDAAHDVVLAEELRGSRQFLQLQLLGTGLHALQSLPGRSRRDDDLVKLFGPDGIAGCRKKG